MKELLEQKALHWQLATRSKLPAATATALISRWPASSAELELPRPISALAVQLLLGLACSQLLATASY